MDKKLKYLEEFFATADLPHKFQLYPGVLIINPKLFVESHLAVLKANGINKSLESFFNRLERFAELIS